MVKQKRGGEGGKTKKGEGRVVKQKKREGEGGKTKKEGRGGWLKQKKEVRGGW